VTTFNVLLPTHFIADQPSPLSGTIYSSKVFDKLMASSINKPGYFCRFNEHKDNPISYEYPKLSGLTLDKEGQAGMERLTYDDFGFTLVGFDVIDNVLHVKVAGTDNAIRHIYSHDWIVRFGTEPIEFDKDNVVNNLEIKTLFLEKK